MRNLQKGIRIVFSACLFLLFGLVFGQNCSLILLGDLHYDRLEDHNLDWLHDKPGDQGQIAAYSRITEAHWEDFMAVVRDRARNSDYPAMAILQAGDLSEGLAGSERKAGRMARHAMKAVNDTRMPAPWIIAKGNHDITGPGAEEAFRKHYVPMIRKQTGNPDIRNASYSYSDGKVQITCLDPWDKVTDMLAFLDRELSGSDAIYKFVLVHEPLIPVTERCWHVYREDPEKREKILELIARHKAVVLCGHLHRYCVVRRQTSFGPVVQVMAVSVVRDRDYQTPDSVISTYGASLAANIPEWHPESLEMRKAVLDQEAKHVNFYKQTDLPGYARIMIDPEMDLLELEYYPAFSDTPWDRIDLGALLGSPDKSL